MQQNYVQRIRLKFSKDGPTRFISHLDLARALERALNRARLPVSYTQGFNPRPRMQFASALPLGFTSESELADVWLAEEIDPATVRERLMARMAPGITIHDVQEVPLAAPALQSITHAATYRAGVTGLLDEATLHERIAAFLAAPELKRERRGKPYDLRPLVEELRLQKGPGGELQIIMSLALRPSETGRPDELLEELGLDPLDLRIHRTAILLSEESASE